MYTEPSPAQPATRLSARALGAEKEKMITKSWFDCLKMPAIFELREDYSWLSSLPLRVERIVNIGCYSCVEPFKLIWTLDAKEIMVVDIEEKYITEFQIKAKEINQCYPERLRGRKINCICGDMTTHLPELADQYYDLVYCEDVLYLIKSKDALEYSISQMNRIVKQNGLIIAVEPKFGAQFETRIVAGAPITIPNTAKNPKDMRNYFKSKDLHEININDCPSYTYCYQRISIGNQ